jgi:hypothetical protein
MGPRLEFKRDRVVRTPGLDQKCKSVLRTAGYATSLWDGKFCRVVVVLLASGPHCALLGVNLLKFEESFPSGIVAHPLVFNLVSWGRFWIAVWQRFLQL